tara:strand:+ start:1373 stop:1606 length:234 start_codon:yes stop_codon:yes gene_type:complete
MKARLVNNDPLDITQYIDRKDEGPQRVGTYTLAGGLPNPAEFLDHIIIIPDETAGRTLATSDGSNWRRVKDGAVASA